MSQSHSRREFFRRASAIAATGVAAPWALNLASVAAASAQTTDSGYRALVCIFLYGGNDNHNTVVPFDLASHSPYVAARGGAGSSIALENRDALQKTLLHPIKPWGSGREMALHPALTDLSALFDAGKLSLAMNIGPLMNSGTTRDQYDSGKNLPPKLFSHNDQQSVWQAGASEGATSGWGGRIGDMFMDDNAGASSFTCISATGNAVYLSGRDVVQYQVSTDGPIGVVSPVFGNTASAQALRDIMVMSDSNAFVSEHAALARRAMDLQATMAAQLDPKDKNLCLVKNNGLSKQLNIVARMIKAGLGTKRQVFFVSLGGFDHHDGLLERHNALMGQLGPAMAEFQKAIDTMGRSKSVTTFTASDFGRTLTSNGDGSDHGWGSHHFVMGGSVSPKSWVGQLPVFDSSVSGGIQVNQQVGSGRLLPYNAVDEYGATLAKWMGVTTSEMATVFPNIKAFNTPDLGFMQA